MVGQDHHPAAAALDDGGRLHVSVARCVIQLWRGHDGATQYAGHNRPVRRVHHGPGRGHLRHGLHHVQLARRADRYLRRADRDQRVLPDGRLGRVRRDGRRDRNVAIVAHAPRGDAVLVAPMIIRLNSERGTSLIETAIATGILLVVMAGLLSMAALATTYTGNHGHLEARTTEYAPDKMEQLLALAYSDAVSDTVVFPASLSGRTGLHMA